MLQLAPATRIATSSVVASLCQGTHAQSPPHRDIAILPAQDLVRLTQPLGQAWPVSGDRPQVVGLPHQTSGTHEVIQKHPLVPQQLGPLPREEDRRRRRTENDEQERQSEHDQAMAPHDAHDLVGAPGAARFDRIAPRPAFEVTSQGFGRLVAVSGRRRHGAQDDGFEIAPDGRGAARRKHDLSPGHRRDQLADTIDLHERMLPRRCHVEQHTERVDVGPGIDSVPLPLKLLRRREEQRSRKLSGVRQRLGGVRSAETEIDNVGFAGVIDQDVGRLQVAMDDPLQVSMVDGVGDPCHHSDPRRKVTLPTEPAIEVLTLQELHGKPATAIGTSAVIETDDVRMLEPADALELALDPSPATPPATPVDDQLQGDTATGADLDRLIDRALPTPTPLRDQSVAGRHLRAARKLAALQGRAHRTHVEKLVDPTPASGTCTEMFFDRRSGPFFVGIQDKTVGQVLGKGRPVGALPIKVHRRMPCAVCLRRASTRYLAMNTAFLLMPTAAATSSVGRSSRKTPANASHVRGRTSARTCARHCSTRADSHAAVHGPRASPTSGTSRSPHGTLRERPFLRSTSVTRRTEMVNSQLLRGPLSGT